MQACVGTGRVHSYTRENIVRRIMAPARQLLLSAHWYSQVADKAVAYQENCCRAQEKFNCKLQKTSCIAQSSAAARNTSVRCQDVSRLHRVRIVYRGYCATPRHGILVRVLEVVKMKPLSRCFVRWNSGKYTACACEQL